MTGWQPEDYPSRAAVRPPVTPPQWGQRRDNKRRDPWADSADGYSEPYPSPQSPVSPPRYVNQLVGPQPHAWQPQPRFQSVPAAARQRPPSRPSAYPAVRYRPDPLAPAARRRPPYPSHLVRFSAKALGLKRRRRGPSFMHVVYLGIHPVALLMSLIVSMFIFGMVASVAVFIIGSWAMWWFAVTCWWLCQVAMAKLRR